MREIRAYKDMEPTYGELAKALESLDFKNKSDKQYFTYVNDKFDAIVMLISKRKNAKVHRAKFAALSWGLEEKGVLKHEYDLGKMIEQHRLAKKGATA